MSAEVGENVNEESKALQDEEDEPTSASRWRTSSRFSSDQDHH